MHTWLTTRAGLSAGTPTSNKTMSHKLPQDVPTQAKTEYDPSGAHYKYSYKGLKLDPYRIMAVYNITNPAQQHAIKKLLRAGLSVKSLEQDIDEVIVTLNRWKEMLHE